MGSRKEEEKIEKIIRGLMKLPPNRRCINCNSLGPQYVCTTFWTFVCITCSGIHREFTHRVKSVSMAKFTFQEVDALQNGGNQRAREIYLKNWDFQIQRLPDSSNVHKVREFMKNVYVDKRYAGTTSSERPPRDAQNPSIHEDEIRRASSYHSYSQSPPYDNQYEDRRYGKQAGALTRKPGSDKVRYEGKISSIIYSPGRFSDHTYDDRFANEGSGPRNSDFSVSSGHEQFKPNVQSPKFHKDIEFNSASYKRPGSSSSEDVWTQAKNAALDSNAAAKRDADGIHRPQRTTSLQPTDSNLSTLRSYNSVGSVDFFSEAVQSSGSLQDKALGVSLPSGPARSVSFDFSKAQVTSPSSVDLFQRAAPSQSALGDLFQLSDMEAAPSFNGNIPLQTSQVASVDFFVDLPQQPSAATSDAKSVELSIPKNEGWATFDTPQFTSTTAQVEVPTTAFKTPQFTSSTAQVEIPAAAFDTPQFTSTTAQVEVPTTAFKTPQFTSSTAQVEIPAAAFDTPQFTSSTAQVEISAAAFDTPQFTSSTAQVEIPAAAAAPSSAESLKGGFDPFSNANMQWPSFEISSADVHSSVSSNVWHDGVWNGEKQVPVMATDTQPWNAFEDSGTHLPFDGNSQGLQLHNFPSESFGLNASEKPNKDGIQGVAPIGRFDNHEFLSNGDIQHNGINRKSTNPFDFPFDSDVDQSDMFLDMSSLQAALPDALLPAAFGGIAEPWLPQNTVTPYISSAGEGGLSFMAVQTPSSQLQNIQAQEPVASVGGNPFA